MPIFSVEFVLNWLTTCQDIATQLENCFRCNASNAYTVLKFDGLLRLDVDRVVIFGVENLCVLDVERVTNLGLTNHVKEIPRSLRGQELGKGSHLASHLSTD